MAAKAATNLIWKVAKRQKDRIARKARGKENKAYRDYKRDRIQYAYEKLHLAKHQGSTSKLVADYINYGHKRKAPRTAVLRSKHLGAMLKRGGGLSDRNTLNSLHREAMLQGNAKATKEITSAMLRMQRNRLKDAGEIWGGGFAVKASKKQIQMWNKQLR